VKLHILLLLLICTISFKIKAQIINEDNRIKWSLSGLNYQPIAQQVILVNSLYNLNANGIIDDALKIQTAINEALPGSLLYFEEGTYLLQNKIDLPSNIIIRGAGANKTVFNFDLSAYNSPPLECIVIATYQYGNYVDALDGYNKNSTFVVVDNIDGFSVNSYAEIEQNNDPELMYSSPIWDVEWAEKAVGQMVKITAINNNTLHFWPPLNHSYRSELNPQIRPTGLKENVGIENLKIKRLDDGDNSTIVFANTTNCWVWNVESEKTVKSHIWVTKSLNLQIQHSYFHQSYNYGGGGHGYGVTLSRHVTNCLVENNIFETLRHAMMAKEGANGNVFSFNYSTNPVWTNFFSIPADISVHGHYPLMNLFESNIVQKISCTDYWGPAGPGNTFFRNRIESRNLSIEDFSHSQNVIANETTANNGSIFITADSNNILKHGNTENGTLQWADNLPPYGLPQSLYLNEGWNEALYSYIGPEFEQSIGVNDAKLRFENSQATTCYTGTSKIYYNENLINNTFEHLQKKLICTGNVVVNKSDTVQLFSAESINLRSGFKVKKGARLSLNVTECE